MLSQRMKLPSSLSLLVGTRRVALWDKKSALVLFGGSGPIKDKAAVHGVAMALAAADKLTKLDDNAEIGVLLGRTPIVTASRSPKRGAGSLHLRVGATNHRVDLRGKLTEAVALDDGREAWLVERDLSRRLLVVGPVQERDPDQRRRHEVARRDASEMWTSMSYGIDVLSVAEAVIADDCAVWSHVFPRDGRDVIVRDGVTVALRDEVSSTLRPKELAVDANLGVVVMAWNDRGRVMLYERAAGAMPGELK